MKIDSIRVGFISTNCYLLCDEEAGVCALIDPGDKPEQVADMVSRSGCRLEYILLTHGHFDHTTAVRPLLEKYPRRAGVHPREGRHRPAAQAHGYDVLPPAGAQPALLQGGGTP